VFVAIIEPRVAADVGGRPIRERPDEPYEGPSGNRATALGHTFGMDDRNRRTTLEDDLTTDADRDARPAGADEAQLLEQSLKLPPDAASVTASDLHAASKRKPASDEVDTARAAAARATEGTR